MKAQKPKKAIPHGSAQSRTQDHAHGFTLVITEKPSAARRIADALSEGDVDELKSGGVSYYRIRRGGRDIVVVSAAGHLFSLTQKEKSAVWSYPVFSVEWKPTWETNRMAGWSKKYYDAIKALAKGADSVISSCDFDIEGSVIAFNIIRFLCNAKDGRRMRFSTLTRQDLIDAYDNASEHLDFPQIDAGLTRHHLDFLWGINMSRALTLALQHSGGYKTLSTGRVQGPVLQLLDVRQREIDAFKPVPFWILQLEGKLNSGDLVAIHTHGEFWKKSEAEDALAKCKGGKAIVDSVETREYHQKPPFPFDLTTLQRDAYLHFHYSPKQTLDIAQSLYEQAVISYPRTSSQKLPDKLGFKTILNSLWKQPAYKQLCEALLKGRLKPNEGPKSDSAHPAIYPTGLAPKALNSYQKNVYDLITRRFLATFADAAKRESMKITIDVSGEKFASEGARTLEPGWMEFYKPYVRLKEQPLPPAKKGDVVGAHKILLLDKETQPPKRLTQASILKEMEKLGLGTKGTRAMILQTLYDRGYISEDSITVTKLGQSVVRALDKYCPDIVEVELTKRFEKEMEEIQEGKRKPDEVIAEAESELAKILKRFKENEGKIGAELLVIVRETAKEEATIGKCPTCGKDLTIRNSKAGKRFVGCSGYPDCTQTYSLPQNGYIRKLPELCKTCGLNVLSIKGKGKRPWKLCIRCGFVNFKKKEEVAAEGSAKPAAAKASPAAKTKPAAAKAKPAGKAAAKPAKTRKPRKPRTPRATKPKKAVAL